ncbi:MAG: hypothetical protein ABW104_07105 [Candidatus Thiodiazotropha sp. 6PLUC2]
MLYVDPYAPTALVPFEYPELLA